MTDEEFSKLHKFLWTGLGSLLAAIGALGLYIHSTIIADIQANLEEIKKTSEAVNANSVSISEVKGIVLSTENYVSQIFSSSDQANAQLVALAESSGQLTEKMTGFDTLSNSVERQEAELSDLFARVTDAVENLIDVETALVRSCEEQAAIRVSPLSEQFSDDVLRRNLTTSVLTPKQANLVFQSRRTVNVAVVCGRLVLAFTAPEDQINPELVDALRAFAGQEPPTVLYNVEQPGIRVRRVLSGG